MGINLRIRLHQQSSSNAHTCPDSLHTRAPRRRGAKQNHARDGLLPAWFSTSVGAGWIARRNRLDPLAPQARRLGVQIYEQSPKAHRSRQRSRQRPLRRLALLGMAFEQLRRNFVRAIRWSCFSGSLGAWSSPRDTYRRATNPRRFPPTPCQGYANLGMII